MRTDQRVWGWHAGQTVPAASLLKPMLLVAYLNRSDVRDRPLRPADLNLVGPMITRSDNDDAWRVLQLVGPRAIYRVARAAGMRHFSLAPPVNWGQTQVDAADQTRFFLHIDRRVVPRHRATALRLLSSIVPSQRWGIGRLRLPGWSVYFKGGWSEGTGAVEHQVALLRRGDQRVSVAVLTTDSRSHPYAEETLRGMFVRLLSGL